MPSTRLSLPGEKVLAVPTRLLLGEIGVGKLDLLPGLYKHSL